MVWIGYPPPQDEERVACGWLWPLYIHLFVKTRVSRLKVTCFSFYKFLFSILMVNVVFNRAPVIRLKANQFFFTPRSSKKKNWHQSPGSNYFLKKVPFNQYNLQNLSSIIIFYFNYHRKYSNFICWNRSCHI